MKELCPVIVALTFNATDLITGIISAVKNKDLQSSKLRDGLFKKAGFMICYFVAWLLDTFGKQIGFDIVTPILPVIVLYVCTTELVSILENVSKINSDILPDKLMDLFHISNKKED